MPAVGGAERREAGLEGAVCAMSLFVKDGGIGKAQTVNLDWRRRVGVVITAPSSRDTFSLVVIRFL